MGFALYDPLKASINHCLSFISYIPRFLLMNPPKNDDELPGAPKVLEPSALHRDFEVDSKEKGFFLP